MAKLPQSASECGNLLLSLLPVGDYQTILPHLEFVDIMLGVQRPSVSLAANALQRAGVIEYRCSKVKVVDRSALEAMSCECYGVVRGHFERLLGKTA